MTDLEKVVSRNRMGQAQAQEKVRQHQTGEGHERATPEQAGPRPARSDPDGIGWGEEQEGRVMRQAESIQERERRQRAFPSTTRPVRGEEGGGQGQKVVQGADVGDQGVIPEERRKCHED